MNGYFGEQVRRLRTQRGLTQRDLARLVGVSQAQISLHEKGEDLPGPAIRPRYASALGITLEELEDIIRRSQIKEYLRASPNLSEEAKRSIEDYIDFAWDRDRRARQERQEREKGDRKGLP
jgi:transcriptional regulator with XRE-family HTH domain